MPDSENLIKAQENERNAFAEWLEVAIKHNASKTNEYLELWEIKKKLWQKAENALYEAIEHDYKD